MSQTDYKNSYVEKLLTFYNIDIIISKDFF